MPAILKNRLCRLPAWFHPPSRIRAGGLQRKPQTAGRRPCRPRGEDRSHRRRCGRNRKLPPGRVGGVGHLDGPRTAEWLWLPKPWSELYLSMRYFSVNKYKTLLLPLAGEIGAPRPDEVCKQMSAVA